MTTALTASPEVPRASLVKRMAARFGVEPDKMLATLKATAFKGDVSNEQMMALLVVADQYGLNPWTRELYAFPDRGGIVPVVSVDGWSRIMNDHPQFDGMEFEYGPDHAGAPEWIECTIYRKDRAHAITVREMFGETYRDTGPWKSHPSRMLRHKAMIQCARMAFGFAGIFDEDEAKRIIEATHFEEVPTVSATEAVKDKLRLKANASAESIPVTVTTTAPFSRAAAATLGVPTYAFLADQINKAQTAADFDLVHDLVRSFDGSEEQRNELLEQIRIRLASLQGQR